MSAARPVGDASLWDGALRDRAGIVTGGGQGIGAATARSLARAGARVVVGDLSGEAAAAVAAGIVAAGGDALAVAADVRREEDCAALAAACQERHGRIDFVVANAGIGDANPEFIHAYRRVRDRPPGRSAGA